ncbi:T9SS type A sorting domain-containing protein [Pseudoflavitalea sp. G-6-1-2]|nr:T9SS type A sorting domain-containing protein [Pseudoflavitalea sp. G-6-1-2]
MFASAQNPCKQSEVMKAYYQNNPAEKVKATQLDAFTGDLVKKIQTEGFGSGPEYTIPVVFHVFGTDFISGPVNEQTIINALKQVNDDFHGLNDDFNSIDPLFNNIKETMNVWFKLAQLDPSGNPTTGINFYPVEKGFGNGSGYDNKIRQYAWDNKKYCNVYIMLDMYDDGDYYNSGVAWYPSQSMTDNNTARIVYNGRYLFGNTNKEFSSTLSHEFGHWLNLAHSFEGGCTYPNDQVDDTPPENASVGECRGTKNCFNQFVNGENYMGYTGASKQCYKMFTQGQVARMLAAIQSGPRSPLWQPANLTATGVNLDPTTPRVLWFGDRFVETFVNDGSINNSLKIRLVNKTFAVTSGNLVQGTHYTAANLPAGLTMQVTVNDATNATITLLGNATAHAQANSISNATLTFLNAAITGGLSGLTNPTNNKLSVLFSDPYTSYCIPGVNFGSYSRITNVKFGTINYNSVQEGVSDLTNKVVTNLTKGAVQQLKVTVNIPNASATSPDVNRIRVWADWNGNFVYETGELVANQEFNTSAIAASGPYTYTTNITVPSTAVTGKVGMRVLVHYKAGTFGDDPCASVESGEFEDYGLNILGTNNPFKAEFLQDKALVALSEGVTFSDISTAAPGTTITSWQWSFPGGTPSSFSGQTPPPVIYATPGVYSPSLTITNSSGQSQTFTKTNGVTSRLSYCQPTYRYGGYVYLSKVQFNTINNSTAYNNITDYYSTISTNVTRGQTYSLAVTATDPNFSTGGSTSNDNWRIRVWADWNYNSVYDAGELIASQQFVQKNMPSGVLTATVPVTIPTNASLNKVGIRVMVHFVYPGRNEGDGPCDEMDSGESEDYGLVIQGSGGDIIAPSAPTNLAASNITMNSVQLNWTASTDNVGVTGYDIYNGTTLAGSSTTTSYNVTGLTAATSYTFTVKAKDAAGNISAASNAVTATTSSNTATYCAVTNGSAGQYVTKLVFGSISNTTTFATNGYGDYTAMTATASKGSTVNLAVTLQALWAGSRAAVWIDWNQDGDFTDAGEQVLNASGASASAYSATVTIPSSALTGKTRMRVRAEYGLSTISSCGNGWHSEVEDYSVNINSGAPGASEQANAENKLQGVYVYPNPSNGSFMVQVPASATDAEITVFNATGGIVKTINAKNKTYIRVELQAVPGVYFVRVRNNGKSSTHSMVIR